MATPYSPYLRALIEGGAETIPLQIALGRSKPDGPLTGLSSTSLQWGLGNA